MSHYYHMAELTKVRHQRFHEEAEQRRLANLFPTEEWYTTRYVLLVE